MASLVGTDPADGGRLRDDDRPPLEGAGLQIAGTRFQPLDNGVRKGEVIGMACRLAAQ